jgi:4-amino-4-deoxy-L-arabinose transferase-like glycosyltransferase
LASLALLITGLTSELYVGDEVYHYRFAKQMYETGRRVSYDSFYGSGLPPGYFYNTEPLWEGGLAAVWKLFGGVSFSLAQVYHTCFYALLLAFTYLVAKEIFGEREGVWSCLLTASMPMAIAFGIIFYVDVPAIALTMMALYWVIRKKYVWVGLSFVAMYLMKRNTVAVIPAMIVVPLYFEIRGSLLAKEGLLKPRRAFWPKVWDLAFVSIPLLATALWDMEWRHRYLESAKFHIQQVGTIKPISTPEHVMFLLSNAIGGTKEYLNSSLVNPLDIIKYLGIVVLTLLFFYFIKGLFRKGKTETKAFIWGMVGSYLIFFLCIFGFNSDIRYLFPIVPLLSILASRAVSSFQKKWINILIIAVCIIQFGSTLVYVHRQRHMPEEIKQGFSFIRTSLPQEGLFMYPEYIFLEATGRKFIWQSFFDLDNRILKRGFFWDTKNEDLMRSLRITKVDYIVIKKSRIYDDTHIKNTGGYPKSFVQRMPKLPFLKCIFENSGMSIWEVRKGALHQDEKQHNAGDLG